MTTTYETYEIRYSDGRRTEHDTYESAKDEILARWPDAEIGHDGDLSDGGKRTLCWSSEEESIDDNGARAVASIYGVRS